ncbi:NCS2 family permease [Clostridium fungisolvens]|uniref:Adenine permease AdeQ n=1 Tax=Clostridium fungisolvens TaxID=1604897 RepID=A0A6V8SM94_9CLOT|nr:NCS2 family permease [Clostridium fungisolvens]GFP75993.1 Adenine permease AdeQ [Clostridium fungisolvens]
MQNLKAKQRKLAILDNKNVDYKKEILAGITTFLAMAYIIAVNPDILSKSGMPVGALVTATCLSAGLTSIFMGVYANLPIGLASGMGLNAFFAFTVCGKYGISWPVALTAVFVEGLIFIILSLFSVREAVVNAIPRNMKLAVTGGIGLFIAFIGMLNSGLVVQDQSTTVALGRFTTPSVAITCLGILIIVILEKKKVKGAMLWGILGGTLVAWAYALYDTQGAAAFGIYLPNGIFKFESLTPIAGKVDFSFLSNSANIFTFIGVVLTFLFVDFFDTVGTLVGVATRANLVDKEGKVPNAGRALLVDAVGTTGGALMGVSAITAYIESATGIEEGGRTGFTAIVTGVLFLLAMFLSPIFIAIPSCATAPALIYVGYLMMGTVKEIDFSDITEAVPAFLTISMMPFTYSIGDGLMIGILSYVIINVISNLISKDKKKISAVMYLLAVIFVLKLVL